MAVLDVATLTGCCNNEGDNCRRKKYNMIVLFRHYCKCSKIRKSWQPFISEAIIYTLNVCRIFKAK
jgi:hypothetical protein